MKNHNNNNYILLVDDEKDILFLYTEWLKFDGYKVVSFDNPIEALSFLNKNDNISNCSLIITDYKMPQMSGLDLIKKIRENDHNSNIKTIIVSAYVKDDLLKDNPYLQKIDKILEKPVDIDTLKNEIKHFTNDSILKLSIKFN
ncbi:MAG TPA: response regulator [Nitrososphaeraceae archaeon]|nr:response regulator [Nitrososphaeraceae archaeon]